GGRESLALHPMRRAGPAYLQGPRPDRADRKDPVPDHRRAAVPAHARRARVLLVLAGGAADRRAGRARGLVPAAPARGPERLGGPAHGRGAVLARDGAAGVAGGPALVPRAREGDLAG